MRLGILTAVVLPLLAAGACVPDFEFGGGGGATTGGVGGDGGDSDGDGGRRRPDGEGGGRRPATVGGLSTTDASGSGGGSPSGSVTTVSTSSGGEGGAGTASTASSTGASTTSSTGSGGTPGVPCFDGDEDRVVVCSGSESACCPDTQYFDYDQCGAPGDCGSFAWELECNESADCGDQRCCVTTDGLGGLESTSCAASCSELEACDPSVGCADGSTCTPIPDLQGEGHPEYGAYGYCN